MVDGAEHYEETTDNPPGMTTSSSWISFNDSPKPTTTLDNTAKDPASPSWSVDSSVSLPSSPTTEQQQQQLQIRKQLFVSMLSRKSKIFRVLMDLQSRGELYQGMTPIISTIFASQFLFFFLHAYLRGRLQTWSATVRGTNSVHSSPTALLSLISSCLAGVGNVLLTNPMWVTNMAIVTGETKTQNLVKELMNIWKTQGTRHLWDGTSASILLVSNPVIQFFCYEQFKHARLAVKMKKVNDGTAVSLGAAEAFLIAALSKGIATVTTYPLQLAQTLLRIGNSNHSGVSSKQKRADASKTRHVTHHQQYKGTIDCLLQLYRTNKTFAAWFTGIRAKLLQTVLTAAFTFLTYEQILGAIQTVVMLRGQRKLTSAQSAV
jgi:adenine nucleotide transporter 17